MKVYRFKPKVIILSLLFFLICVSSNYFDRILGLKRIDIIPILISVVVLISYIDIILTKYVIENGTITLVSLFKRKTINFNEVIHIGNVKSNQFIEFSVVISTAKTSLKITSWIKNYNELIQYIINECSKNKNIIIVEELLKK